MSDIGDVFQQMSDAANPRCIMNEREADTALYAMRDLIASHIACEKECQTSPTGCGCALTAARAVLSVPAQCQPDCDKIALDAAYEIECLTWNNQTQRTARVQIVVAKAIRSALASPAQSSLRPDLTAGMKAAMEIVGNMRQSEAGLFDPMHSGQRGEDRSNALYDAYCAIRRASQVTSTEGK